jgi:hypothetical protein
VITVERPDGTKFRAIRNLQPGQWWIGEYPTDDGQTEEVWAQVSVVMQLENRATGRKSTRVLGRCTDGEGAELHHYRGHEVPSLSAAQARKAGLTLPDRTDSEATP